MGFLDVHTPIDFEEAKKYHESIKTDAIEQLINDWKRSKDWKKSMEELHWGDEMEYMLTSMPSDEKAPPKPYYHADKVLDKLHEVDEDTWKPEYASYMIEGVKVPPLVLVEDDIAKQVLSSLISRRRTAEAALPANVHVMSIPAFPTLGAEYTHRGEHLEGPTAESILVPDEVITPHVRFQTLTKSVRARKGAKVAIAPPLYKDVNTVSQGGIDFDPAVTPWELKKSGLDQSRDPLKDRVYLDATVFGFGQCCLQVVGLVVDVMTRSHHVVGWKVGAVAVALERYYGMVTDVDARYELLSQCVDDRTVQEADPRSPEFKQQGRMPETIHRKCGIGRYVSTTAPEAMSDLVVEHREDQKQRLLDAGMDEVLADYFAYIFYRDPMIIFKERIHLDNEHSIEHFEGMYSTHWTIVRIKPPPANQEDIHWRVELRTPDVQVTDYENAAIVTVAALLARAIVRRAEGPDGSAGGQVSGLIPISKVRENMLRSQQRDALRCGKFWWNHEGSIMETSMVDIWCARGGLLDVCRSELKKAMGEAAESSLDAELINFIEARVRGKLCLRSVFTCVFIQPMRILPVALIVTVGVVGAGDVNCTELGFDPTILKCDTCVRLRRNLELQKEAESIEEDCRKCCNLVDASGQNEIYEKAELVTSRMAMEARQDLSDFVKRKVPELKKRGYEITVTAWFKDSSGRVSVKEQKTLAVLRHPLTMSLAFTLLSCIICGVHVMKHLNAGRVRHVYLSFALYSFLNLMVQHMETVPVRRDYPLPLKWCLPPPQLDMRFLTAIRVAVLQFVFLKPICAVIAMLCSLTGYYKEGEMSVWAPFTWLFFINHASLSIAMYALATFYWMLQDLLEAYRPLCKFALIKLVVFLPWFQYTLVVTIWFILGRSFSDDAFTTTMVYEGLLECVELY
ncbi:Glutamate--cysteine ligase catalytic subunit, putative [Perkinsus marinus ATCC 50983]|uniref:Glutamate--cysteine ligase n=1 Tax=Perkinsus marinus (strain ATCC 50983 / TXsc) TaxID=423536 RepID=C5LS57_PERM5|nr:Glutamate--cysteine ligase catalytic subunit, putative [Perkinsus marinus ATCC 50983]EER00419.1 Glutamate--cysteine ligase catalytic subunit, putative [Perkinsus marinus ATCC 50983]|eukprot:XP_002767701.1 Glutamate--cysteine ligase catalytic subunit, putative [Perkinsus marinus ATCC 50983]